MSKIKQEHPSTAVKEDHGSELTINTTAPISIHERARLRAEEDYNLKMKGTRSFIIEELGYAPKDHPTVVLLTSWAQELRDAANSDPVLRFLQVQLPKQVEVTVVFDDDPNAFVFKEEPDKIFITTGLLQIGATREEIISVIAHEQGHSIYDAILRRESDRLPAQEVSRFGETIWRPAEPQAVAQLQYQAIEKLSSRAEEGWCDTYGSYPAMNKCGVNPLHTARLEAKFGSSGELLPLHLSTSENFLLLLRSHPVTSERIWLEQRIAQAISYPAFLTDKSKSFPLNVEVPRDLAAEKFVQILEKETGFFSIGLSNLFYCGIPSGIFSSTEGSKSSQSALEQYRYGAIESPPSFIGNQLDSHSWVMRKKNSISYSAELHGTILNYAESWDGDDRHLKLRGGIEVFCNEVLRNVHCSFSEPLTKQPHGNLEQALLNVTQANSNLKGSTAFGKRVVPPLIEMIKQGSLEFLNYRDKHGSYDTTSIFSKRFKEIVVDLGDQLKARSLALSDLKLKTSTLKIRSGSTPALKKILNESIRPTIEPSFALLHTASTEAFGDVFIKGRTATGVQTLASMDVSSTMSKEAAESAVHQLINLTQAPLERFLAPVGAIIDSQTIAGLTQKILESPHLFSEEEKAEFYLQLAKLGCCPSKRECSLEVAAQYFPSLLPANHPNALAPLDLDYSGNRHEYLAIKDGILDKNGSLESSFIQANRSLAEALKNIESQPHLFSPSVWRELASQYVASVSDLDHLTNFLRETFAQHQYQYSSWRENTLVESLCFVFEQAASGILDQEGLEGFNQLCQRLDSLDRCALRNPSVAVLVKYAAATDQFIENATSLLKYFELEPAASIATHTKSQLVESGSRILRNAEKEIEILANKKDKSGALDVNETYSYKQYIPYAVFETDDRELQKKICKKYHFLASGDRHNGVFGFRLFEDMSPKRPLPKSIFPTVSTITNALPLYATSTMLRHTLLTQRASEIPVPTESLSLKPKVIQVVEDSGAAVMQTLQIVDPLIIDYSQTDHLSSRKSALAYYESVLQKFQPIATPLRDHWITRLIKSAEVTTTDKNKYLLTSGDLRRLQRESYLPESKQLIGEILVERLKNHYLKRENTGLTPLQAVRYVSQVMPYYSVERNTSLQDLLKLVGGYDYEACSIAAALHWTPGLPNPIPGHEAILGNSFIESQLSLLENFDDFEKVAAVLYLNGTVSEKPFAVSYMECLFGGTFESLQQEQKSLSPGARLEILNRIFGGTKGVLVNEDRAALSYLSATIFKSLSSSSSIISAHQNVTKELLDDLLWKAKLPVSVRVELLSSFLEWGSRAKDSTQSDLQAVSDLVGRGFAALGAPGMRILQGIVIEPKAFSPEISSILRESQDSIPPGPAQAPFHLAQADGVNDLMLSGFRGGGTLGEIHGVASVNGVSYEGVVQKSLRPEVLRTVAALEKPLKHLSKTLEQHGFQWGEALVDRVIRSCAAEYRAFSEEAARTGPKMAELLSSITETVIEERGYTVAIPVNDSFEIIIPRALNQVSRDGNSYTFLMGDLGESFTTFSKIVQEHGRDGLAATLKEHGIELSEVADLTGKFFVGLLLDKNTLLKDLHFGNTGIIKTAPSERGKIGMLDFGGVVENFPEYEKRWLLTTVSAVVSKDQKLQRDLLLLAARSTGSSVAELQERLPLLESILTKLNQSLDNLGEASPLDTLQELLATLYEEWPLTQPVREFVESLRKVAREWGPHMSETALQEISITIVMQGFQAVLELQSSGILESISTVFDETSFDQRCEAGSSPEALEHFEELSNLPEEAKIVLKDQTEDRWETHSLRGRFKIGDKIVTLVNQAGEARVFQTTQLRDRVGYVEFEGEDGELLAVHVKDAF